MKERLVIKSPQDCIDVLHKYSHMKQEHFGVIFLDGVNGVIQKKCFFIGSNNVCPVYPKLIWWKACQLKANSIILFHNHPSGNFNPSELDVDVTNMLVQGGKLLGIRVLDHIIVSKYGYYSFLEENRINQDEDVSKVANK